MRDILTEIGLSKEEGDLDFLLTDIVDAAENGAFLGNDRKNFGFVMNEFGLQRLCFKLINKKIFYLI